MLYLRFSKALLLSTVIVTALIIPGTYAGFLDGLTFGWGSEIGREEENQTPETFYYQEDMYATAAMMMEFINKPMYFVAFFKYRPKAIYEDGRTTKLSGFDADKIYTQVILSEILPQVGGELVYSANFLDPQAEESDENAEDETNDRKWDAMAILYFPSSISFGRMIANPKFNELTVHKKAGLADTLVFACDAINGTSMAAFVPILESTNSTNSTASSNSTETDTEDETDSSSKSTTDNIWSDNNNIQVSRSQEPAFATVSLLGYNRNAIYQDGDSDASSLRLSGRNAVQLYDDFAIPLEESYGMRTAMYFAVRQSLIAGEAGWDWDEIRIHTYPSESAWQDIQDDTHWQIGRNHYEAGLKQRMELAASPMFVNALGGNAQMKFQDACNSESVLATMQTMEFDASDYCP
mgnify:CR=1 FL=1